MTRIGCVMLLVMTGCIVGDDGEPEKTASATVEPTTGNTVTGTATFTSKNGNVMVAITIANAPEGVHGMHIHQVPMCGNGGMDAGGHWDGGETAGDAAGHGLPDGPTHHLGDMGNITIAADGTGTMMTSKAGWKLGDGSAADVVNRAIIFHANMDDGTMASAGGRLGCGVITAN